MFDGVYEVETVEAIASVLRSMDIGKVFTTRSGDYIHLDIAGVAGELMFSVPGMPEEVAPVKPDEDIEKYRVSAYQLGMAPVPPAPRTPAEQPVSWKQVTDYYTAMQEIVNGSGVSLAEAVKIGEDIMAIADGVPTTNYFGGLDTLISGGCTPPEAVEWPDGDTWPTRAEDVVELEEVFSVTLVDDGDTFSPVWRVVDGNAEQIDTAELS